MKIVVTGGLGYLGSHVVHELLQGSAVELVTTLDRGTPGVRRPLARRREAYIQSDVLNPMLSEIGMIGSADVVIHLAALIEAPQSVLKPELYYRTNFVGTLHALELAQQLGATGFVFASSAAVYGASCTLPVTEEQATTRTENPYGGSKLFGEALIEDVCRARGMQFINLRLFNLVGAGAVGVVPRQGGLFSVVTDVMAGKRHSLKVYGINHQTKDGTAVRDYVDVQDAAKAFQLAAAYLEPGYRTSHTLNVGTGAGASVEQVIDAANKILVKAGKPRLSVTYEDARAGEVSASVASVEKIGRVLNWQAQFTSIEQALDQEYSIKTKKMPV